MGVVTSHGKVSFSYGGLLKFLIKICETAGYGDYKLYKGLGGDNDFNIMKNDNIKYLLRTMTCKIHPNRCKLIAPRLKEIIDQWDDNYFYKFYGELFVKGLNEAYEKKEYFTFY